MKRELCLILLLTIFLTSCATLLFKKDYYVKVKSNAQEAKVQINDSIYTLPAKLKVERSKKDLPVKLIADTITRNYIIKSRPSPHFLFANLILPYTIPLAYLIDFTNPKRFYYGKTIFLNVKDTTSIIRSRLGRLFNKYYSKTFPVQKGQINLSVSLPWINNFYLHPRDETPKINTGFWGFSSGLEYYYNDDQYLSLNISTVMDFFVPIPAAVDISGEYESMESVYISLTTNSKLRHFTYGYGINYSHNNWQFNYYDWGDSPPPSREPVTKTSNSLGVTLNGYHQIGKHLFIGIIYRPTVLNVSPLARLKYEHLISIDFMWKGRIKK